MQDGTDDTTPADSASDTTAAPPQTLPASSSAGDEESPAPDGTVANGFHLPNGSADHDGFRRQHDRRTSVHHSGRNSSGRAEPQQGDDSFRCITFVKSPVHHD